MRSYILLMFFFAASALHAQNFIDAALNSNPFIPRPYVFGGPTLMPGGYAPLAFLAGAGIRIDSEHFLFDVHALYDNGHKVNDNHQPNPKGHDRALNGSMYFRFPSGWSFGGGASWSQLSTTEYTKSSWHPRFGGNRDFFVKNCIAENCQGQYTMRIGADYFFGGNNRDNGTQGVFLTLHIPSPSLNRHFFFREKVAIYRYHDTVTTTPEINRDVFNREMGTHHFDSYMEATIMYRF
ncbi:MAG TPA: hypothetical protein VF123_05650 [Candidatus Sulfotelmatobacter sp.]